MNDSRLKVLRLIITGQKQSEKAGVCLLCSTMSSGVSRNHPRFGKCAFLVPPKTIPAKDATRVCVNESALPEKEILWPFVRRVSPPVTVTDPYKSSLTSLSLVRDRKLHNHSGNRPFPKHFVPLKHNFRLLV